VAAAAARRLRWKQDIADEHAADRMAVDATRSTGAIPRPLQAPRTMRGGLPLDTPVAESFSRRFGVDFSDVRIHTDGPPAIAARRLGASAFALGADVAFAPGEFDPGTRAGELLLGHELAHVAEQSRGSRLALQPKLVALGDTAGFVALASSIITTQFAVSVSPTGDVSLSASKVQGPPTPAAQELASVLRTVIGDPKTTSIEFIHGQTTTRPSDAVVIGGNYALSRVDLDDIAMAGPPGGRGVSSGAWLSHEIQEQYRKQVHSESFPVAHAGGLATEARASNATLMPGSLTTIDAHTIEWTDTYTFPDGTREDVTVRVRDGNIVSVNRRARR